MVNLPNSIKEQILQHSGETFDVTPFVDVRYQTPIEEIQATVDNAISMEQAIKLKQCLNHINELEVHKAEIEREIFRLNDKYKEVLALIRTVPRFDRNPMTAIQVLSEIGDDISVFPQLKTLFHELDAVPTITKAIIKSNPPGFPVLVLIFDRYLAHTHKFKGIYAKRFPRITSCERFKDTDYFTDT